MALSNSWTGAFFRLVRINNLLILALMQYCARIFIIGPKEIFLDIVFEPEIFCLSLSTIFIAAGGYIINDYYDIKIDMINKPERVVLNKTISRRAGLVLHLILNALALFLCVWKLTLNVAIFMFLCGMLLWWYSNSLKRTAFWGNFTISFLAFSSLSMLALFYQTRVNAILFFSFFAFLNTLIREIIKDMEDVKGDEIYGCKTLPIVYGIPFTKNILYLIILINLSVLAASILVIPIPLYVYLIAFTFFPCVYIGYLLYRADTQSAFVQLANFTKYMMVAGILGMILT